MVHFEGTEQFTVPPAELFAKLTDAGFLVNAIPDAEVHEATPDRGVWKLKPKLSFISGTIDTTLRITERTPPTQAKYEIVGKGVGAGSTVAATLNFEPDGTGTKVNWNGDITALTGLLKLVPKGLIQSAAGKIIADVWAAVHQAV
jgi:uncharacterized protein